MKRRLLLLKTNVFSVVQGVNTPKSQEKKMERKHPKIAQSVSPNTGGFRNRHKAFYLLAVNILLCFVSCAEDESKSLTENEIQQLSAFSLPDNRMGLQLANLLSLSNDETPMNDADYFQLLQEIRKEPTVATKSLWNSFQTVSQKKGLTRWLIANTLADLQDPSALRPLQTIATAPLPSLVSIQNITEEEIDDEVMIRYRAIEGLRMLAGRGLTEADDSLVQCMKSSDYAVRIAAANAYLRVKRSAVRENTVKALLPSSEHWIVQPQTPNLEKFYIAPPAASFSDLNRSQALTPELH
jgi:hypothetical protein